MHDANKPTPIDKPNNLNAEQQAVYTQIAGELEKERTTLVGLETQIAEHQARQKTLIEHLALAKKLEGKLDNFEAEFARLKQECTADCKKLSLDIGTIITLTIHKAALTQKRDDLVAERVRIDATLSATEETGLVNKKAASEARIKAQLKWQGSGGVSSL